MASGLLSTVVSQQLVLLLCLLIFDDTRGGRKTKIRFPYSMLLRDFGNDLCTAHGAICLDTHLSTHKIYDSSGHLI